jgi:hypothetical protein
MRPHHAIRQRGCIKNEHRTSIAQFGCACNSGHFDEWITDRADNDLTLALNTIHNQSHAAALGAQNEHKRSKVRGMILSQQPSQVNQR